MSKLSSKEYNRKRYESQKNGYHNVYFLPMEGYIGVTVNLHDRMLKHKRAGKDTENWKLLYKCTREVDAALIETFMHALGFNGHRRL